MYFNVLHPSPLPSMFLKYLFKEKYWPASQIEFFLVALKRIISKYYVWRTTVECCKMSHHVCAADYRKKDWWFRIDLFAYIPLSTSSPCVSWWCVSIKALLIFTDAPNGSGPLMNQRHGTSSSHTKWWDRMSKKSAISWRQWTMTLYNESSWIVPIVEVSFCWYCHGSRGGGFALTDPTLVSEISPSSIGFSSGND